tara:strand:- start:3698 stop:4300 length:603 start_codon:yes stop_codon:yes gene_type:complete
MKMRYKKYEKTILTDCDGVLLDWEWAFNCWMIQHGFETTEGYQFKYDMAERYGITKEQVKKLIKQFNESAAIGFLPVLRDAMYWVKRLHEQHGYTFICITSLSLDENAAKLREMNLQKMFGKTAFSKVICLDTGADKDEALSTYKGSNCYWIEDKPENAEAGLQFGLRPIVMEHGHNMHYTHPKIKTVKNWEKLYRFITI